MTPVELVVDKLTAQGCNPRRNGAGWEARCPAHDDQKPSLSVGEGQDGKAVVCCHAGANCSANDITAALGLTLKDLFARNGNGNKRRIEAVYGYTDELGKPLFEVVRYHPKDFRQRRPDGNGGVVWKLDGVRRVLYRLPAVSDAVYEGRRVFVVEGEKDVEALERAGEAATCNPGGAGKWSKVLDADAVLKCADVVICRDMDEAGLAHAVDVARSLLGRAASLIVAEPADGLKDIAEHLGAGHTLDELTVVAASGIEIEPPVPTVSEWLAVSVVSDVSHPLAGVPSGPPMDGITVLDEVHAFLGRFVAYPSEHAHVAHTLWIAHTHLMDAWESTPRIAFLSPEPGSGKTRALEVSELLVPRPVEAVNTTPAYLFRKVSDPEGPPTILYDEVDTVFGPKAKDNEEIRGMLNAGHRRGAMAGRCVVRGKIIETEELPAYCAVALAGIGGLPDTILSRCVIVLMRRRAPNEHVESYRRRVHSPDGHELGAQLGQWAGTVVDKVTKAWPLMPDGIEDRDADVWEPLLAVADAAGGDWPEVARAAAVALVAASKGRSPSLGVRLLADLHDVFGTADVMSTDAILEALHAIEEAPWSDLRGKPLNARGLATRLREYGVRSQTVRLTVDGDDVTRKGYKREELHDPWSRYLGPPHHESVTSDTSGTNGETVD